MYVTSITPGEFFNTFDFALKNIQYALNSVSSLQMLEGRATYKSRVAAREAFEKIEELSEETKSKIINKLDKISEKPINSGNIKEIVNEFQSIFNSPEFHEYKKIVSQIPQTQQKNFLREVFVRIEGKLLETRNYISNSTVYSKKSQQIS